MEATTVITEELADATRDAKNADRDVTLAISRLRRDLDKIEQALASGYRVEASVSGGTFVESTADELVRLVARRENAHATRALLERVAKQIGGQQ